MNGKRFLLRFLACSAALLLLLAGICAAVDPFLRYRVRNGKYFLSTRFITPGLIRNYDYDAAIIGSSFTQNFNMDSFRQKLSVKPLKVTLGGMTPTEIIEMHTLVKQAGKAKTVYLCLPDFLSDDSGISNFPPYLVTDSRTEEYRYLLGYEAWMRYIPTDAGLALLDLMGIELPEKFRQVRSIDYLDYWADDNPLVPGALKTYYTRPALPPYDADEAAQLTAAVCARIDAFLAAMDLDDSIQYALFFTPYSALHYCNMSENELEAYLCGKAYLVNALAMCDTVTVYDFQCMDAVADLDNYCDQNHFGKHVNEMLVDHFSDGGYRVSADSIGASNQRLLALVAQFRRDNADWL